MATKVDIVKAMSEGAKTLSDDVIEAYLDMAGRTVMNRLYPFRNAEEDETVPERYEMVQIRAAVYAINRRGSEGETKHIEVGTERDFSSADVPDDLLKELTPMCGVPT